jgi:5-formyltetrahydrofolate cyclo-ligase
MPKSSQHALRYRVRRGAAGMWEVVEEGVPAVIASFHGEADAAAYARRLAARRGGEVLVEAAPQTHTA